jgi:hypothetical protein
MLVFAMLIVAGCASQSELTGKQKKNSGVVQYERLGTLTTHDVPAGKQCNRRQVQWCAPDSQGENCTCIYVHSAKDRIRRMAESYRTY